MLWRKRAEGERNRVKLLRHESWKPVKIRYLFQWIRDEDPALSKLVGALKQGKRPSTWRHLSKLFVDHHLQGFPDLRGGYVLPLPSKGGLLQDHSYWWAAALAKTLNLPFGAHLRVTVGGGQKNRSREARKGIRMESSETPPPAASLYILVDDVLTTGATSRAAMEALSRSGLNHFEIWTLALRSRLAPSG